MPVRSRIAHRAGRNLVAQIEHLSCFSALVPVRAAIRASRQGPAEGVPAVAIVERVEADLLDGHPVEWRRLVGTLDDGSDVTGGERGVTALGAHGFIKTDISAPSFHGSIAL